MTRSGKLQHGCTMPRAVNRWKFRRIDRQEMVVQNGWKFERVCDGRPMFVVTGTANAILSESGCRVEDANVKRSRRGKEKRMEVRGDGDCRCRFRADVYTLSGERGLGDAWPVECGYVRCVGPALTCNEWVVLYSTRVRTVDGRGGGGSGEAGDAAAKRCSRARRSTSEVLG